MSPDRAGQIRFLVDYRFPELWRLNPQTGRREDTSANVPAERLQAANDYASDLKKLADHEFNALFAEAQHEAKAQMNRRRKEVLDAQHHNRPDLKADFSYWSKLATWTSEETVVLSLGKEPRMFWVVELDKAPFFDPLPKAMRERREIINRAIGSMQLSDPVSPARFLRWAEKIDLELPAELISSVKRIAEANLRPSAEMDALKNELESLRRELDVARHELTAHRTQVEQQAEKANLNKTDLTPRERTSLLKLVIGMAIGGYGHTPRANRSPTVSAIQTDLENNGIPLDADTVRKYLNEASNLLPRGEG